MKAVSEFIKIFDILSSRDKDVSRVTEVVEERVDNTEEIISGLQLTNKLLLYNIRKFELIFDNLNDGIIILDPASRFLAVNHIMEQLLGLKRDEMIGKHIRDFHDNNPVITFMLENYDSINRLVEKTEEINTNEVSLKVSYKTLVNDSGNSCGSILIVKDITTQKLAEEAKIEFLSHVSHELKTPLSTIKSYTEMLVSGEIDNRDTLIEFVNIVNEEVDRLSSLINNLLHLSKIEMGSLVLSKTMTRTREFLEHIFRIATTQKKKDITYELSLPEKISPINIDKEFMGIALMNIIGNAIKYTPEHGKITLKAEEDGDKLMIHIIDTGVGISEEEMSHIFDKFYRSSDEYVRNQAGHGLGLAMARQIAKLHDGEIIVRSKKGEGTQFIIILPIEQRYFIE